MEAFDIAGLCAHPDDAELVMGGTLAREAAAGRKVALVDLTRGESGSRGSPAVRAAEAAEAARVLGASHRESLGLPAGFMLGRYRLEKIEAEWGFYLSYLAQDTSDGRAVAVHELLPEELVTRAADGTVGAGRQNSALNAAVATSASELRTQSGFDE